MSLVTFRIEEYSIGRMLSQTDKRWFECKKPLRIKSEKAIYIYIQKMVYCKNGNIKGISLS
jgi:hypothetical protein